MSAPSAAGGTNGSEDSTGDGAIAKTAGFVVLSGIAMSILKSLYPFNHSPNQTQLPPHGDSTKPIPQIPPEPVIKILSASAEQNVPEVSTRTVVIVKGDTLWGLSKKYGVSIDAIKEANGLTGDRIYAGKKLIIP